MAGVRRTAHAADTDGRVNLTRAAGRVVGVSSTSPTPEAAPDSGAEQVLDATTVETFEAFYRREMPRLVALARVLSGSSVLADDLAQETMIVAYRRWDEVRLLDRPASWVRKVCAYKSSSQLRRATTETRALLRLSGRADSPSTGDLDHEDFWREVRRLPRRQAQVIALHYVLDMGVAAVFGPGVPIADAAIEVLDKLNKRLGYAQDRAAE